MRTIQFLTNGRIKEGEIVGKVSYYDWYLVKDKDGKRYIVDEKEIEKEVKEDEEVHTKTEEIKKTKKRRCRGRTRKLG